MVLVVEYLRKRVYILVTSVMPTPTWPLVKLVVQLPEVMRIPLPAQLVLKVLKVQLVFKVILVLKVQLVLKVLHLKELLGM